MQDKEIKCKCGTMFTFSAEEQQYFSEMMFDQPKRCKPCREIKKRKNEANNHNGYGHEGGR